MNAPIGELISLRGKTALVTGGASGIGLGIALRLAEAGANVLIADIQGDSAEKAAAELREKGYSVQSSEADVSSEESVRAMIAKAVSIFGGLNILVNNAGIYPAIPIRKMSAADFERVLSVNLKSVFLCTKYAAEQMLSAGAGGKIINVSSIDALHPSSVGLAHYDASKHGVWGFTKNSALEFAAYGIAINAIAPGGIATPGSERMQQPAMSNAFLAKIPMKRLGEADDIGRVALFLASDLSSYMTGSQIVVDGGFLLS